MDLLTNKRSDVIKSLIQRTPLSLRQLSLLTDHPDILTTLMSDPAFLRQAFDLLHSPIGQFFTRLAKQEENIRVNIGVPIEKLLVDADSLQFKSLLTLLHQ